MTSVRITATGRCFPEKALPNSYFYEDLGLETNEEWIRSRTGIHERRIVDRAVQRRGGVKLDHADGLRRLRSTGGRGMEIDVSAQPGVRLLLHPPVHAELAATAAVCFPCPTYALFPVALVVPSRELQVDRLVAALCGGRVRSRGPA